MIHKLFENFLENTEEYTASEMHWKKIIDKIERSLQQEGEWKPWIPRQFANGTPIGSDGNPIFDGFSRKLNRAFRIIQHRAVDNDLEFVAWIKKYEAEFTDLPGSELVINLSLSVESSKLATELLSKWMSSKINLKEINSFIKKFPNK
jgi:hypothetical protein